jgi:filamentous hemagglutinin family protein
MKTKFLNQKLIRIVILFFLAAREWDLRANPAGMTVISGNATAQQLGSQLNVTVGQLAILNWSSFNIGAGETTSFLQPSSSSVVFNIIGGANPSQIFGNLNANGTVILANANGFYFGPNSMIKVGGSFIATTAPLAPDFGSGAAWQFSGMPPLASIVNYGQIQVGQGRSLFLIAEDIKNYGKLDAPGGNIELASGQEVLVSDSPDGRGLSAKVQMPQGSVDNFGNITADAGTIALQAKVVNEDGIIQANSVQNQGGVIELTALSDLTLGANSQISANGDSSSGGSVGGTITLQAGNNFSDNAGSQISATGGSQGGNGGNIEVSAPNILSLNSTLNAGAQSGWSAGTFLLDPANITLGTSTSGGAIDVNTAFAGFSTILLQASGNITLNAGTTWNLSGSTGESFGQLTLEAGGNIIFGNTSKILDANNWSVTLDAGYNFADNAVQAGTGYIYLNGGSGLSQNGTIQLGGGSVNLYAGESILVGSGSVFTTGGGSIFADALDGDINAGTSNGSGTNGKQSSDYLFTASGARPNAILGGISTADGGDVTLIAGDDIVSVPTVPTGEWSGASGTYGSGNVTLVAGNQITGNYNLANGVGTILAGVSVTSSQAATLQNPNAANYNTTLNCLETAVTENTSGNGNIGTASVNGGVTLSLIQGSWNAWAANDIYVNEVNNPNGTFNTLQDFAFNYAPNAAANFWAGNAINLVGGDLARVNRANQNMPPVYAPVLTLNAGAGGITVDNSIILAPSTEGELQIITRDGGDLSGTVSANSSTLNGITMSDSGSSSWTTFAAGHASTPLYVNNPNPVTLDISGSIESFGLTVPTFADINVVGNTYNFGFLGQNLSPSQTTSINVGQTAKANMEAARLLNRATDGGLLVGGNITYRGDLTSETLSGDVTSTEFGDVISDDPSLAGALSYDPTTGTISYIGVMSAATEQSLLNPTDTSGNAIFTGAQLTAWQATIGQLYSDSQSASLGDNGLALAGPGNFNITANTIDLGISGGISVLAPDAALAAISPYGANINITTAGDLEMTTSVIANESLSGGNSSGGINLTVGGTLDVGGELTPFGDPDSPKGIFTTSGGNISITANDDVNVDGSRIAAYDGGNINITSSTGDINAGTGGAGYVTLNALELDPGTGQLEQIPATIPGSGILATTIFGSDASLGNITLNAPAGSVNADAGGIIQIAFNGANLKNNYIQITAGDDINAQGSGIIGANIELKAGGDINGVVIGSQGIDITSAQNVDVTAISSGNVDINASGDVSGTIVSGGNLDVSGSLIDASLIAENVSASGDTAGASLGIPQSNVASVNTQTADDADTATSKVDDGTSNDEKKKRKQAVLAQKVSRVTVTLPAKTNSRPQNQNPNSSL